LLHEFGLIERPQCKIILLSQRTIKKFGFKTIDQAYIDIFEDIVGKKYVVDNIMTYGLSEKVERLKKLRFIDKDKKFDYKSFIRKFSQDKKDAFKPLLKNIKPLNELIQPIHLKNTTIDIVADYNYYMNLEKTTTISYDTRIFKKFHKVRYLKKVLNVLGITLNSVKIRKSLDIKSSDLKTTFDTLIDFNLSYRNTTEDIGKILDDRIKDLNREIYLINSNFNFSMFEDNKKVS
jgi:hypothetical protein